VTASAPPAMRVLWLAVVRELETSIFGAAVQILPHSRRWSASDSVCRRPRAGEEGGEWLRIDEQLFREFNERARRPTTRASCSPHQYQVGGLDVAVNYAGTMGRRQPRSDGCCQCDGFPLRQRSALGYICLQGGSRQQVHDEKGHVPVGTAVEDGHDAGMLQPGRTLRFPLKGPGDAARIARRAKQTAVGVDVTTVSRSAATRVQPPLPALVRAELGANLIMEASQLTPAALTTFKHAASMSNPKFYELQRLRKSTWDTPRFIRGYDVTFDDQLVLPRGLRHRIAEIIERSGARLIMSDVRNPGREIDVTFNGELNTMQASAVSTMLAHDDGVLVAPPGAGKTVMACAVIAERATSTLVLVDRKALAEQWRTRLEEFLGIRPGQHGGRRKKLTRHDRHRNAAVARST
jgi:hypothetical protein